MAGDWEQQCRTLDATPTRVGALTVYGYVGKVGKVIINRRCTECSVPDYRTFCEGGRRIEKNGLGRMAVAGRLNCQAFNSIEKPSSPKKKTMRDNANDGNRQGERCGGC